MSTADAISSFIEGAPPGELDAVTNSIKTLTSDSDPAALSKVKQAYQRYNEEQLVCTKLPGSTQYVSRHSDQHDHRRKITNKSLRTGNNKQIHPPPRLKQ